MLRWEALFADLEAAAEEVRLQEREAEVADQARAEYAAVRLADRIRAWSGSLLTCELVDGRSVDGVLREVGADWLLLQAGPGEALVPFRALAAVAGPTPAGSKAAGSVMGSPAVGRSAMGGSVVAVSPEAGLGERLPLSVVLRGLSVRRAPVRLTLPGGRALAGTIDRVGVDHLDLAVHDPEDPRRRSAVTGMRLIPLTAVLAMSLGPV